jgi:predicted transcriptional regulator
MNHVGSESHFAMPAAFTVRLDDDTLAALDRLAEQTERSRSWLVSRAVEDYVSLNEWQIARIREGIAAADRGDFASDEEMERIRRKFSDHE